MEYGQGKNPSSRNGFKKGHKSYFNKGKPPSRKGAKHTVKAKEKMSITKKKNPSPQQFKKGEARFIGRLHWNWQGGKSFEPYSVDWTKTLKRSIRERDNYTCQICSCPQGDEALSVHHIDKNKQNCNPDNLITLCRSCHTRLHRKLWK